jgi:hypothetical protein
MKMIDEVAHWVDDAKPMSKLNGTQHFRGRKHSESTMRDDAPRKLAQLRERYSRDIAGRKAACNEVVLELAKALKVAGLEMEPDPRSDIQNSPTFWIHLGKPVVSLRVMLSTDGRLHVGDDLQEVTEAWKFDPVDRVFRGPEPEHRPAVDLLADLVIKMIDDQAKKMLNGERPVVHARSGGAYQMSRGGGF